MDRSKGNNNKGLQRNLGIFSVFSICTGVAFSSFFLLPGIAAEETGSSLPLAFFAAAVAMLPALLSISELSAAMPRSGGPYFFVTRSFGPLLGLIGALGKFTQLILKGAFAFVGFGIYLSMLTGFSVQLTAVILIILITLINLFGTRQTARAEKLLVIILLFILAYFLIAGANEIFNLQQPQQPFSPLFPFGWTGFASAIALVFISFGGVAQVASVSEEVRKPSRSLPRGMLLSLAVSSFFYIAGTAVIIGLLPPEVLWGNETPPATAAERISSLPLPLALVAVAALTAFTSTGNAAILAASRYPLALARDGILSQKFSILNAKGVPKNAVLAAGFLCLGVVALLKVKEIAKTASAFLLFVFLAMCLAVIIFRESRNREYDPGFKSPFYPWTQITGILLYIWLILESGMGAILFITGVILTGILWYTYGLKEKPHLSAAIYELFARVAHKGKDRHHPAGDILPGGGSQLFSVVERAVFIDLDSEEPFDKVIQEAAETLRDRLGGSSERLAADLKEEVRHWKNPVKNNISAAPALIRGIEQPEMVIIRGKIKIEEGEIAGLIVLVDDENSSDRLLKLLAQLEMTLNHQHFAEDWKKADNPTEIRKSFLQGVRSLSIRINESNNTRELIGTKIEDLDLPAHTVIGAVYREGRLLKPSGETKVQEEDELIFISQGKAFKTLLEKFPEGVSKNQR